MLTKTDENIKGGAINEDYPKYDEVIFGGTFFGTSQNPNPAVISKLPDKQIRITAIPLNSTIIYKEKAYHKMTKKTMEKIKQTSMDGKELKNNYLVLYSDKSITTRTKSKDSEYTGSFMTGAGELVRYNTETKKFIIKNANGENIEIGKNYFILCYQVDKQEISKNDIKTLEDSTIDPVNDDEEYDFTVEPLPTTEQDIEALNNYPIPTKDEVLKKGINIPTAPIFKEQENAKSELLPITRETETTPTAVETTSSANPNNDIQNEVIAPVVQSEGSTVETTASTADNSGSSTPASSSSENTSNADKSDYADSKDDNTIIENTYFQDSPIESDETFNADEMQYLQNLINETNKRFKIQSFKKLFETKRYNNPILYTYLVEL
jgi:hypothetical protein